MEAEAEVEAEVEVESRRNSVNGRDQVGFGRDPVDFGRDKLRPAFFRRAGESWSDIFADIFADIFGNFGRNQLSPASLGGAGSEEETTKLRRNFVETSVFENTVKNTGVRPKTPSKHRCPTENTAKTPQNTAEHRRKPRLTR